MKIIDYYEAMIYLPNWIERANAGEEVVIAAPDRKTGVRLVPVPIEAELPPRPERVGGQLEGKLWIAPDFDEVPEEVAKAFGINPT